jgi:hypothetical protein
VPPRRPLLSAPSLKCGLSEFSVLPVVFFAATIVVCACSCSLTMPHEKWLERLSPDRRSSARRPFTRSVEFPKVALLAHGKRTRPRWTAAATATAETCSRYLNLSTRMTSARRSLGSLRRQRDLLWSSGAQLSSRSVEAH